MATAYVGNPTTPNASAQTVAVDNIVLRPVSVREACNLLGIGLTGGATAATARGKGVLYSADASTGEPATLLGTTAEFTGVTNNLHTTAAFAAPVALTPGNYWLGVHVAVAVPVGRSGTSTAGNAHVLLAGQTYASGAPSTWPGGHTLPARDWFLFGYYESDGTLDAHTFGKLTTGVTNLSVTSNRVTASRFTLSAAANVSHLTTRFTGTGFTSAKYRGVIYAVASGEPAALLGVTNESAAYWRDEWIGMHFPSPIALAAGDYYLGIHASSNPTQPSDIGGTNRQTIDTYADGAANPWGTTVATPTAEMVIYASYTLAAPPIPARVINPVIIAAW